MNIIYIYIYIRIYFGLRDLQFCAIIWASVLAIMLALLFLRLLLVGPPVVQGAFAFGHIIAMVIPDDVGFGVCVPVGQATMSRVCILFQDDSHS